MGLGDIVSGGFDLLSALWDRRTEGGGVNAAAGFRRVGGAILALLDQTTGLPPDLSSSDEDDGGGRSPYKPPNIFNSLFFWVYYGKLNLGDFYGDMGLSTVAIDDDEKRVFVLMIAISVGIEEGDQSSVFSLRSPSPGFCLI